MKWALGAVAAVTAVGVAVALSLGAAWAAVGVGVAALSGLLSLQLKAKAGTLNAALVVMSGMFLGRLLAVAVGVVVAEKVSQAGMVFGLGFLGAYFPLQAVEIRFVLSKGH